MFTPDLLKHDFEKEVLVCVFKGEGGDNNEDITAIINIIIVIMVVIIILVLVIIIKI